MSLVMKDDFSTLCILYEVTNFSNSHSTDSVCWTFFYWHSLKRIDPVLVRLMYIEYIVLHICISTLIRLFRFHFLQLSQKSIEIA